MMTSCAARVRRLRVPNSDKMQPALMICRPLSLALAAGGRIASRRSVFVRTSLGACPPSRLTELSDVVPLGVDRREVGLRDDGHQRHLPQDSLGPVALDEDVERAPFLAVGVRLVDSEVNPDLIVRVELEQGQVLDVGRLEERASRLEPACLFLGQADLGLGWRPTGVRRSAPNLSSKTNSHTPGLTLERIEDLVVHGPGEPGARPVGELVLDRCIRVVLHPQSSAQLGSETENGEMDPPRARPVALSACTGLCPAYW